MKKFNWLFLTLFAFVFVACDDDDEGTLDTTAPTISITSPAEGAEHMPGDVVSINFNVTDDLGLETITLMVNGTNAKTWDVNDFLNDDTNVTKEYELTIPENTTAGPYTISIDATDNAGNTATTATRTITVMEAGASEAISIEGIEEGQTFETLGGTEGVPATFTFQGEEGIDSVNVSARTEEGDREILNRGFNQTFFDENNIDNSGDFSFQDNLMFPNTINARGANNLTVRTFRGGQMVGEQSVNTNLEPAAGTSEVTFNATPSATLPEGSRVFASGNFTDDATFSRIDDPGFELMEDQDNPGTFGTTVFADPNRDVSFRFSRMDADGTSSFELDENCQETTQDFRTFSPGTNTSVDAQNVNFLGLGDCQ